jgi:hypothetical protein
MRDPGEENIFVATGIVPFEAPIEQIYEYVAAVGQRVGQEIRRNRGLPPGAKQCNMLSTEEKALVILGRAIGVSFPDIADELSRRRVDAGEEPPDRARHSYQAKVIVPHRKIVEAIHADILDAVEVYSPLVSGSARLIYRARMLEFYRQQIHKVYGLKRVKMRERETRISALDKSIDRHMKYFDQLMSSEDVSRLLGTPSDQVRSQSRTKAEEAVEDRYEAGEITDGERIDILRKMRHGELK